MKGNVKFFLSLHFVFEHFASFGITNVRIGKTKTKGGHLGYPLPFFLIYMIKYHHTSLLVISIFIFIIYFIYVQVFHSFGNEKYKKRICIKNNLL